MLALFSLLAAFQDAPGGGQPEARKIFHRVYEGKELALELQGDTLKKIDNDNYVLTGIEALLFTRPTLSEPRSRRVEIHADEGTYDSRAKVLRLRSGVRMKTQDDAELTTAELRLDQVARKVRTDGAFVITRPDMIVRGEGLTADERIENVTVDKGGRIELKSPRAATVVESAAAMTITQDAATKATTIALPGAATIDQVAADGDKSRMTADMMTILAARVEDPVDKKEKLAVTGIDARGHVLLSGAAGDDARADALTWDRKSDRTDLDGAVHLKRGANVIAARKARMEGKTMTAEGDVRADLRKDEKADPSHVECDTMTLTGEERLVDGKKTFVTETMTLFSNSGATLTSGSRVSFRAPQISFKPESGFCELSGPRQILLIDKEGKTIRATCRGVCTFDREARTIVFTDAVQMIGPEFSLTADAARVLLDDKGEEMVALFAQGNVDALQNANRTRILCDRMDYDPASGDMLAMSDKGVAIDSPRGGLQAPEALLNAKTSRLETRRAPSGTRLVIKKKP